MNTIKSTSVAQVNEETYNKLLVSIEAGIGMLQIFLAVCDADNQREGIIANYERELAPAIHTYRVYLNPQEPSLRLALSQQVTIKENAIATVIGAETLGLSDKDESLDKFFGYLQWTREGLRELKMPIVLWIPSRIFAKIAKKSPDFYSWRNGVFQFQPEVSLHTIEPLISKSIDFTEDEQFSSVFSVEQLESSLEKAIAQWGENSSNVEPLYSQLGNLYGDRVKSGKSADREHELTLAEDYLKKAIELQTQFKQNAVASSLNNLAELYRFQGRYKEAESLYLQVLELCQRLLGDNHPFVAASFNNLALLYRFQGRYEEAESIQLQALALDKQLLGDNHPDVATSLNNLALLYRFQGRYEEAESLHLQALELDKQLLGENHPYVATSLNNLAELYRSQGRYEEAESLHLQALELRKQLLGENHPYVATSLNNLAELYRSQGRYEEAEPLYLQALSIAEISLGNEHPNTKTCRNNLQMMRQEQNPSS